MVQISELIDAKGLSRLKWRCRRGLLENDIFIERFFRRFGPSLTLTVKQSQGPGVLIELSDHDLTCTWHAKRLRKSTPISITKMYVKFCVC